jgi:hypothetical protein
MGLQCSPTSPCLFKGVLIEGQPPIYIGLYVDDIIYFSTSDEVEKFFETTLTNKIGTVNFMGQVSQFLGIELHWTKHSDDNLSVTLTQQSFSESLIDSLGYLNMGSNLFTTPYHSGLSIDSIDIQDLPSDQKDLLRLQYQSLVGSLNWLAHTTHPDLSTVVSLLAQYQSNPSPGHYEAAKYVVRYLAATRDLGIKFTSAKRSVLESFLHFPIPTTVLSMSDANWGPQDASLSSNPKELPLFASRSMSAFYVDLLGPLHWKSTQQKVTAASSAEAEIYATDECVKFLLELVQIVDFLGFREVFMPSTNIIYNDNSACVNWSKNCTTKGLRHIQMRENHIRENIMSNFI